MDLLRLEDECLEFNKDAKTLLSTKVMDRLTHEHFSHRRDIVVAVSPLAPSLAYDVRDEIYNFFIVTRRGKKKRET